MKIDELINELADEFCRTPLPESVCADRIACERGAKNRSGTNLLTVIEAREVLGAILRPRVATLLADHESVTLTVSEIIDLAEMAGLRVEDKPIDNDELDAELTIARCPASGVRDEDTGATFHHRHVAYFAEYPEEGVCPLGAEVPAPTA